MSQDLRDSWADINVPPKDDGCVRCHAKVNDDGSEVMWRCAGCNRLVCRDCTLCLPGWRRPTEPHGPSGYDHLPSAGGREYLHDTLCSRECWERIGSPEE